MKLIINHSEKSKNEELLYDTLFIGLTAERDMLYYKINKRVEAMMEDGLLDEARSVYDSGIRTKAVMTPIGYKELFDYFDGQKDLNECLELIKQKSRNYVKRQYTWFNNQVPVIWFNVNLNFLNTENEILEYITNRD